jgi:hypothetical protein
VKNWFQSLLSRSTCTATTSKYSKALDIGRRIENLEDFGDGKQDEERQNDRRERELERELQLGP